MNKQKFAMPPNVKQCAEMVWVEYSNLARKYNTLNLGQGAPDFLAPKVLISTLEEVAKDNDPKLHQYARVNGHPRLQNIISEIYSPLVNREINPAEEILITNGASEALYCAILGYISAGDEIIIMEPYFDAYEYLVRLAGGTARYIPLRPKENATSSTDWVFDKSELESLFNSKTKMIILNTPHNPTGKVFTISELQLIAELCIRWDVLCISDEVYEWMIYKPNKHERIATLPGMWERTITIGSAGKTFSATGWKTGWAYGPSEVLCNLRVIHQNCVYCCCTPLQDGLARAFEHEHKIQGTEESYFNELVQTLQRKREFTANFVSEAGMKPVIPEGGYFMLADWTSLADKANLENETDKYRDYRFSKWMIKNIGLQVIPVSAFYSEQHKHLGENYIRFCFIKEDSNLQKAENILKSWTQA